MAKYYKDAFDVKLTGQEIVFLRFICDHGPSIEAVAPTILTYGEDGKSNDNFPGGTLEIAQVGRDLHDKLSFVSVNDKDLAARDEF